MVSVHRLYTYLILLLVPMIALQSVAMAQEVVTKRDIGARVGVGLSRKFINPFKFEFTQDIRLEDDFSKVASFVTDAGLAYKIDKNFSIGTHIRYVGNRKKDDFFYHDLRNDYDLNFKIKLGDRFKLKYRLKFQKTYGNLMTMNLVKYDPKENKSNFRNKLQVEYEIGEHTLFLSFELFREYKLFKRPEFNKMRINLGDVFGFKKGDFTTGLSYELDWSDSTPLHFFFLKLYYNFDFDKK